MKLFQTSASFQDVDKHLMSLTITILGLFRMPKPCATSSQDQWAISRDSTTDFLGLDG